MPEQLCNNLLEMSRFPPAFVISSSRRIQSAACQSLSAVGIRALDAQPVIADFLTRKSLGERSTGSEGLSGSVCYWLLDEIHHPRLTELVLRAAGVVLGCRSVNARALWCRLRVVFPPMNDLAVFNESFKLAVAVRFAYNARQIPFATTTEEESRQLRAFLGAATADWHRLGKVVPAALGCTGPFPPVVDAFCDIARLLAEMAGTEEYRAIAEIADVDAIERMGSWLDPSKSSPDPDGRFKGVDRFCNAARALSVAFRPMRRLLCRE